MYNKACEYITGFIYFIAITQSENEKTRNLHKKHLINWRGNCFAISYKVKNTLRAKDMSRRQKRCRRYDQKNDKPRTWRGLDFGTTIVEIHKALEQIDKSVIYEG